MKARQGKANLCWSGFKDPLPAAGPAGPSESGKRG